MRISSLVVLLVCLLKPSFSQTGNSFLAHYAPSDERIDYRSMGMVQDERGLIYYTNRRGVLEFDGKNWQLIATPGAVYTIALLHNEVYVGGIFGFGKLTQTGNLRTYQSLHSGASIFSSVVAGDKVYACSENSLFIASSDKIEIEIKAENANTFGGLFEIYDTIFLKTTAQGLLQLKEGKLVKPEVAFPSNTEIIFSASHLKSGAALFGTQKGQIYLMKKGSSPAQLKVEDSVYLRQNNLVNGVWVNEKLLAFGTLLGGVILVNATTGATEDHIDFTTGLPDNEVFALMADRNEGVWVAHEYGFTRIAPSLPFRSFNHYPGLSGNLLCIQTVQDRNYVGTTLGLFQLTKEEIRPKTNTSIQVFQSDQQDRRGLFGFLKKKDKQADTEMIGKGVPSYETKIIKSLGYSYQKVEGITGKVMHLIEVNGKLIAAGLGGVFEVNGLKAKSIVSQPVRTVFFSVSLQQLLVGTYRDEVKTFSPFTWQESHLLDTVTDHISYAFEDNLQNIWLCGRTEVYRIETVEGKISDATSFAIANPSLDEMVGVAYGNEVYLAASGEFKKFNRKDSFVRYDSLPGPHRYFASAGYFWFNDGSQWRTVDARLKSLKLQWLGLFPNLRFLSPNENGQSLWVITADNELYKFSSNKVLLDDQRYPLLLREVRGQEINLTYGKQVTMDQPENELAFEFVQPDYISRNAMQYRYYVKGLTNGWTSWSNSNHVANFPFLPPGNYQLSMQSRDLLGNESKIEIINFEVLPPYWKRWWFYAFEFVFFSMLMFLSVKLSVANSKYRYISQILSLLTVIIFIQFINTAINSVIEIKSSPVIQFLIQVIVALLVFPIELYFRKFMQAAAEGKYQIRLKNNKPTNS